MYQFDIRDTGLFQMAKIKIKEWRPVKYNIYNCFREIVLFLFNRLNLVFIVPIF